MAGRTIKAGLGRPETVVIVLEVENRRQLVGVTPVGRKGTNYTMTAWQTAKVGGPES